MVIQETLRLYYPVAFVVRETLHAMDVRGIQIPKGINLQIYGDLMYTSSIKPERFAQGTPSTCKIPQAYMPFGVGPPICAGQHFAMLELKGIHSL